MISYAGGAALRTLRILVCVLLFSSAPLRDASAYVVPPEQLLEFMAESVAGFETLGVTWEHRTGGAEAGESPVVMNVWFRSPDDHSVLRREEHDWVVPAGPGAGFLELFCGKTQRSERFLARQGVDLGISSYTRLDRTVAYRIGRDTPDAPVLLLEKSRFIPLLLCYEPDPGKVGETMEIRFQDYRRAGKGWFPHEILYRTASGVTGSCKVLDIRPNEPVPAGFSSVERLKGGETVSDGEGDRLERAIRAFEDKYGN